MIIKDELGKRADKKKALLLQRFFKTGKGEYGEGDIFLGVTGPRQREIAKRHASAGLADVQELLDSRIHEHRQTGLFMLAEKFRRAEGKERERIYDFYLANTKNVNNWDLVDCSAHKIVGEFLVDKDRAVLYKLAKSESIWERRIAVISTFAFIRDNDFKDALKISEILLQDGHDLIHKAVGWMLREVGKKDEKILEEFLRKHSKEMPRTMLRYAIEKFPERKRKAWLKR